MPLYDYHCESCGHTEEVKQKITDAPLKECPKCKSDSYKRQIGTTSFQLNGGGWYKDGYEKPKIST